MSYIVDDMVVRAQSTFGKPRAEDWEVFIGRLGILCVEDDLPDKVPAMIAGSTIVVQRGLTPHAKAERVWHEMGHWFLHVGSMEWWSTRPQGLRTVARFERQASEFKRLFPVWSDGAFFSDSQLVYTEIAF